MKLIEHILQNYYLPLSIYFKNNMLLTQSLVIKNEEEALVFNDLIKSNFNNITINEANKSTWKYYKNLAGNYYEKGIVDKPVYVKSKDNFEEIEVTKENLNVHILTKKELLKFDSYYKDLASKYPLQELYIRSVITDQNLTEQEIVEKENFTILSYNKDLVEEQEYYLIPELQKRLNNYKVTWLLNYYCLSDSLYLSAQICELYNFLLKNILSLRLEKSKTSFAHTFFIFTFLASHYYLEDTFYYLNRKQLLFLYKNLLYLQNHVGNNFVFKEIIDYIFTERNISLVTYKYKMLDSLNEDNFINYHFKQSLLNNKNLPYSKNEFSLDSIKNKELLLANKNKEEYEYNFNKIDFKFRNSLFNELYTKDIESIIIDFSDNVRYKLIETLISNFIYLTCKNKLNYYINFTIPISNEVKYLTTSDFLKFFIVTLYFVNNERITSFPNLTSLRVYKEDIISFNEIRNFLYKNKYYYKFIYNNIVNNIPRYSVFVSSFQFEEYITKLYKFDIGLWLLLSNMDDKNDNGQFEAIQKLLIKNETFSIDNETVENFLNRLNLNFIYDLNIEDLNLLLDDILNAMLNNKLKNMFNNYFIQKSLLKIFRILKSYSTQLINEYYVKNFLLTGIKDTRYAISEDISVFYYYYNNFNLNTDAQLKTKYKKEITQNYNVIDKYNYIEKEFIDIRGFYEPIAKNIQKVSIYLNFNVLDIQSNQNSPTQEQLLFLASNFN